MKKIYFSFIAVLFLIAGVHNAEAQCTPGAALTFNNTTPVAIADVATTTSTITVAGAPAYLYDLNIVTAITHTFPGDLDITITSPSGTVVTLTTDNAVSADDVFNGTTWDDDANPAGQVPYTSNNGLVTDQTYVLGVPATPLVPEEPLGAFIGENPNGTWTITISDDAAGDVGNLNSWSLVMTTLIAAPTLTATSYTNTTPVAIADVATTTSTIVVAGAGTQLFDVNVITGITHTFPGDLDITITSPAGTVVTLTTDNAVSADDVFNGTTWDDDANPGGQVPYTSNNGMVTDHTYTLGVPATPLTPEEALAAFIGENPNGTWTITISDDAAGDVGNLSSWGLNLQTSVCSVLNPCSPSAAQTFTNTTPVTIPLTASTITSTITVAGGPAYLSDLNVLTNITHSFSSDLDITIKSPAGTIVTLTTDNAGVNDNVYNGTLWDDNANPGGQVPYTANNGLATDHTYTNLVVATPLVPEEPLGAFIGEDPNGVWTITVSDDSNLDGGSLNSWSIIMTGLAGPPVTATTSATNTTPVVIPTTVSTVTSTITIAGAGTQIKDVDLTTFILHTASGDIDMTITSPSGKVVTLTTDNGGALDNVFNGTKWNDNANPGGQVPYTSNNGMVTDQTYTNLVPVLNLTPEEALSAFVGENPNGVWTLTISDDAAGNGGTLTSWTLDIVTSLCPPPPPCAGTPAPGSISGPATACVGTTGTLTLSGQSIVSGLGYQWKSSTTAGGPYIDIPGANATTYNFTSTGTTKYYIVAVTCISGGQSANTPEFRVQESAPVHLSPYSYTVTSACTPGAATITATVTNGIAPYTHTLTGPGTIVQNAATGAGNSTGNFTVTNLPAGNHTFIFTSTDAIGCSSSIFITNVPIKETPGITLTPAAATICNGQIQPITAAVTPAAAPAVTWSPIAGLYTNALGTIAYTGTATNTVYAKPTTTTTYTATSVLAGCTGTKTIVVTVNQLPAITVQPLPVTQTICPGFPVTYTVTATGTGLTYQWRRNGTNLSDNAQISGATTNSITITGVTTANAGNYDVVVTGICSPAATSNAATLVVGTAPTITTQPNSPTVCQNSNAVFTVVAAGAPTPTIYQWEVSTNSGGSWTPLTTGGSYTPTLTVPAVTLSMNGYWYRVIITNSCNQSITSSPGVLTVNPIPAVTVSPLPAKICISDTLLALTGSPVGGSWSGIGVSGFSFVPTATAVGTYTLRYTYTSPLGCANSATVIAKVEDCQERLRLLEDDALILYPNPNNGKFNIRINSSLYNYLGLKVYNQQGQLINGYSTNHILVSPVYSGLVYGRVIPIDLSGQPSGIYLVKFYYDDGVRTSEKTFKVVVSGH